MKIALAPGWMLAAACAIAVSGVATPGAAQMRRVPVLTIGIEFPLTDPAGTQGMAGRTTFPASVTQIVTDAQGTRREFNQTFVDNLFGATHSVAGQLLETSYGQLILENAGVFGPFQAKKGAEYYWSSSDPKHSERKTEAVAAFIAEEIVGRRRFDLSLYDRPPYGNGDGTVTEDELVLVLVAPQSQTYGLVRSVESAPGSNDPFRVGKVDWRLRKPGGAMIEFFSRTMGSNDDLGTLAHELAHIVIDAGDMYENSDTLPNASPPGWDPTAPGPYSLMDNDGFHSHLDPLHKIEAGGWVQPVAVVRDGYYELRDVASFPDIYQLAPAGFGREYFLVENRNGGGYDEHLPAAGLAIWHIDESRLPNWRTAVELEQPVVVQNPIQWDKSLWSSALVNGGTLDFWHGSQPRDSKLHDGRDSQIGVWAIGDAGPVMRVFLDVPGPGVLIEAGGSVVVAPGLASGTAVRVVNTGPSRDTFRVRVEGVDPSWISFANVRPASVDYHDLGSELQLELDSYEQALFDLRFSVPRCADETASTLRVIAASTSDPNLSTEDTTSLTVRLPQQTPAPDVLETNDSAATATSLNLSGSSLAASGSWPGLTLHTDSDVDYFAVRFPGGPDECLGGATKSFGSMTRAFDPRYSPGTLTLEVDEVFCRPLKVTMLLPDGTSQVHASTRRVSIPCPTAQFPARAAVVAVESTDQRKTHYALRAHYGGWSIALSDPLPDMPLLRYLPPTVEPPALEFRDLQQLRGEQVRFGDLTARLAPHVRRAVLDLELGELAAELGRLDESERLLASALELARELGSPALEGDVSRALGLLAAEREDPAAEELLAAARAARDGLDDPHGVALDRVALARLRLRAGAAREALALLEESYAAFAALRDAPALGLVLIMQAEALGPRHPDAAAAAAAMAERAGEPAPELDALRRRAIAAMLAE